MIVTGQQVAQLIAFVAPGFVARAAYGWRLPRVEPPQFTVLLVSVVLSLPLVAITGVLARPLGVDPSNVTALPYVALLFGLSVVLGYLAATIRATRVIRRLLQRLGLVYQPEQSLYAQTMVGLPPAAVVTVSFLDGRKLAGTPQLGPGSGTGIHELYLTHPSWWDEAGGAWVAEGAGGGVIVPLANVHSVTLDRDVVQA